MNETSSDKKRYVVGFLVDKAARKVLLVKKDRPEAWAGRLTGPGGKIEGKETPVQAMRREFYEECGMNIGQKDWKHTIFLDTGAFTLDFFVTFGNPHKARRMETEELVVAMLDHLPEKMFTNARWALTMSLDEGFQFPLQLDYKLSLDAKALASPVVTGAESAVQTPAGQPAATGVVKGETASIKG